MNFETNFSCTLCRCTKVDGIYNSYASKLLQEHFPEVPTPSNLILCNDCSSMLDLFHNTKLLLIEYERSFKQKESNELNLANFIMWSSGEVNDMNEDRKCQICSKAISHEESKNFCDELILQVFPFLDSRFCSSLKLCIKCKNNMNSLKSFKMKYSNRAFEITYLNVKTEFSNDFEYTGHVISPKSCTYISDDVDCIFTDFCKISVEKHNQKRTINYKVFVMETIKREIKPIKRNGVYLYNCPNCENIVLDLEKHFEEHKEHSSQMLYSCDMCNFQTESLDQIQVHICEGDTSSNESSEKYKCVICPFTAKQKGNLKTHSLVHKSTKEIHMYKCDQCKFQSRQKGNLKTHLLVHKPRDEINMFKCTYCSFEARQKGNLQTHVLKKHKKINEVALLYKQRNVLKKLMKGRQ